MRTTTDTLFTPLTIATAPEASRPVLETIQKLRARAKFHACLRITGRKDLNQLDV